MFVRNAKWLHTSEDLILIAKLCINHIFFKDLLEGARDHDQQVKQSLQVLCTELCRQQTVLIVL